MAVRARDIREQLKGKVDPVLMQTLESMAEIQHQQSKTITELTTMVSMCVMACESFNMISEGMKKKLDSLTKEENPELGPLSTKQ